MSATIDAALDLRVERLDELPPARRGALLGRGRGRLRELAPRVRPILDDVRERGDAALLEYSERFDGVRPDPLRVPDAEIAAAPSMVDPAYLAALRQAAANIEAFHRAQLRPEAPVETTSGVRVWREWRPIERVGIYVPGGGALYPSCLLMAAIPARVAGCREIVVCTPPNRGGRVSPEVLAAAALAGVTELYAVGGVQAIAAMAYGTETIRPADKLFGAGGPYVTAAKALVAAEVAIDALAGPSEILILADETANPEFVAADLLAQAEHVEGACVLITPSAELADAARAALLRQLPALATAPAIRANLAARGALLVADTMDDALDFANEYAAEHLEIVAADATSLVGRVRHAGSVFLGGHSPVAAGDYVSGGNHTLPTAGYARGFAPLAIESFGRQMQMQRLSEDGLGGIRAAIETLAGAEGLPAHAASIRARFPLPSQSARADFAAGGPPGANSFAGPLSGPSGPRYSAPPTPQSLAARLDVPVASLCKLDGNESPYGPPPRALAALAALANDDASLLGAGRYPDPGASDLRAALAAYTGAPATQIAVGNGLDELLYLLAEATLEPGDEVVTCEPTFSVYALAARRSGARVVDAGRGADFGMDADQLCAAITPRTRLVFLCSPNNPTGTALPRETVLAALERIEAIADPADPRGGPLIALDEAYHEFGALGGDPAAWTALPLRAESRPVVVLRTFSKLFGLAGLRVGYAICPPDLAARLRERKQPYNVNVAGQIAARAALDDLPRLADQAKRIVAERDRLARGLADITAPEGHPAVEARLVAPAASADSNPALGLSAPALRVYPSAANFLLVDVLAGAARRDAIWEGLLDRGIMLRRPPGARLGASLRITVGTPEENDRLLAALQELLEEGALA